jgi:type IV fimbrial biogenesis protein FimT
MSRQYGFTLLELIVTVVVAGIVVTMAVPSFTDLTRNVSLTTAANDFVVALNLARSTAGKRGVAVNLRPADATGWGSGWTIYVDTDGDGSHDDGEETLRRGTAPPGGVTFAGGTATVRYRPSGTLEPTGSTRSFNVCDDRSGETGRRIEIAPSGRVSSATLTCS